MTKRYFVLLCDTAQCLTSTTHHNRLRENGDWGPQLEVQYYKTIDIVMKFAFSIHPDMSLRGEYIIYFECQSTNWMIYVEFHYIVSFSLQDTLIFIHRIQTCFKNVGNTNVFKRVGSTNPAMVVGASIALKEANQHLIYCIDVRSTNGTHSPLNRHEICPKFYTAGFSGQNFYTVNFT